MAFVQSKNSRLCTRTNHSYWIRVELSSSAKSLYLQSIINSSRLTFHFEWRKEKGRQVNRSWLANSTERWYHDFFKFLKNIEQKRKNCCLHHHQHLINLHSSSSTISWQWTSTNPSTFVQWHTYVSLQRREEECDLVERLPFSQKYSRLPQPIWSNWTYI